MASFGMVYSGAPLFMWIYSTRAASFVNNIAASHYSREGVWATPYELIHGERFADSSIVVPFGVCCLSPLDATGTCQVSFALRSDDLSALCR